MKNILIVEDNFSVAETLVRALQREYGPEVGVYTSRTGENALKMIYSKPFDLLITDWQLPGISGLQLILKIRPVFPQLKIIFITAYPSDQIEAKVQELADVYLPKPFRTPVLIEHVHNLFGQETATWRDEVVEPSHNLGYYASL